jgi:hypothetical protein
MSDALTDLLARAAISDVLGRYCLALDWLDQPALETVFWPDAAIDYGFFKGDAAAFIPLVMDIERSALRRWHGCMAETYRIKDTQADVASYALTHAVQRLDDGTLQLNRFYGRYLDRFASRGGQWRISARTYLLHAAESSPVTGDGGLPGLPLSDDLTPSHPLYVRF